MKNSFLEKHFQTAWNHWVVRNWKFEASNFELKYSQGKPIPFNWVKPHQVQGLLDAKYDIIAWKYSDIDPRQKPFDSSVLTGMPGYVILGYHPDKKIYYLIDVDDWVKELATSKRKSITKERAKEISTHVIEI